MNHEIALALQVLLMAALALTHSLRTRGRDETLLLLVLGIGFGYVFPLLDINLLGHYTFHGELTLLRIPFHLGLGWYGLFYLALCLAERLLPARASSIHVALLAGVIFGLLEAQWDPTLLALGMMELFVVSFASYPFNFNPGLPISHAYLGFSFVLVYRTFRGEPRPLLRGLTGVATLVVWPLGLLAGVPLFEPVYHGVAARLDNQALLVVFDLIHFITTFVALGWITARFVGWLGRRLGSAGEASG